MKIKNMLLKKIIFFINIFVVFQVLGFKVNTKIAYGYEGTEIVYFFSPTCGSCVDVSNYLNDLQKEVNNIKVNKYNIFDQENKELLLDYCLAYQTTEEKSGVVPIVFVGDKYLFGEEEIVNNLRELLEDDKVDETLSKEYVLDNYKSKGISKSLNFVQVSLSALLNGLNPCSFTMFMILLMLLSNKSKTILKVGLSFCFGKILAFLLIGSVLYNLLGNLNNSIIIIITKIVIIIIYFVLVILNINDIIMIRRNKQENLKAQLPSKFRKFNHKVINYYTKRFTGRPFEVISGVILGMVIASNEFLCTGQIYLSTIVSEIQSNSIKHENMIIYLLLYSIICTLPLILVVLFLYKGKKAFEISLFFTNNIIYIKMLYVVFFTIFTIYMIMDFLKYY
ncbi:MAG: hypothetical protein ACLR8H_12510 [Clostridium sp.]